MARIVVTSGSARRASFNTRLARLADALAREAGAESRLVDPTTLRVPLYDGDLEASDGIPEGARTFKGALVGCDGFVLACPEYNSSITPLLKNAIDWASRAEGDESPLVAFRGRAALLLSTAPGALGGLRGLSTVRAILANLGVHVFPDQLAIPGAARAFDEEGGLVDATMRERLHGLVTRFVDFTSRLVAR